MSLNIDKKSGFDLASANDSPCGIAYNPAALIEAFHFIGTHECHCFIYHLWRQVRPIPHRHAPKQTIDFINQNA